jgi:hypothetical protein
MENRLGKARAKNDDCLLFARKTCPCRRGYWKLEIIENRTLLCYNIARSLSLQRIRARIQWIKAWRVYTRTERKLMSSSPILALFIHSNPQRLPQMFFAGSRKLLLMQGRSLGERERGGRCPSPRHRLAVGKKKRRQMSTGHAEKC